jgi:hypothetical protein
LRHPQQVLARRHGSNLASKAAQFGIPVWRFDGGA